MTKRPKPVYRKLVFNRDLPACWYCGLKTDSSLSFPKGDEVWCCKVCAVKYGKIKRFLRRIHKPLVSRKKLKNTPNPHIKNSKTMQEEEVRDDEPKN